MVTITLRLDVSIRHGCYHPLQDVSKQHGRYHPLQDVSIQHGRYHPLQNASIRHGRYHPLQIMCKNLLSCENMCLTQTCITCLEKSISSSILPFVSWAYHLCLNFWLFCRSCLGGLVLGEIRGRPPFTLHPMGTTLLMMRLIQLASRQLGFYKVTLTTGVMTPSPSAVYPQRPVLGGVIQSRRSVSPLSPIQFLVGLSHSAGWLQGEGPLEE